MKLKKQFDEFYNRIKVIENSKLIDKRKILQSDIEENLPEVMEEHSISLKKSEIEFFDQGSYKYNTTINDTPMDRDVAVLMPLDIEENDDPRKIKGYVRDSLNSIHNRTVSIKEPCVTTTYYENDVEWMHIDMPVYAKFEDEVYLARGKEYSENYLWEKSDPKGLNDYLCNLISNNSQLRRVIMFIKKWKSESYKNSTLDHEIPPSIGITLLACDCFEAVTENGKDDDLSSLQKTMSNIKNKFTITKCDNEIIKADITRLLPVEPYTDVFSKMKESSNRYGITFYKRLSLAVDNLTNAVNVDSEHDAGKYVQKALGEEFEVPEKEAKMFSLYKNRERNFG